jgi:hypothetical protein
MGQGTAPAFGAGAGEVPTTGYNGWAAPASGISASYLAQMPVAVPAANQLMLFPAPTSSLAQATWVTVGTGASNIVQLNELPHAEPEHHGQCRHAYNAASDLRQ